MPLREYLERSCVGCGKVALHDVDDAHAFVQACITRSGLALSREQRDELVAEGLRALTRLAREYQPGRGGRDAAGSRFSGYAAKFLPGKLSDAWHRIEGHTLVTQADQSRKWQINQRPVSLQAIEAADGNALDQIATLQVDASYDPEVIAGLPALLDDFWQERCAQVTAYVQLRSDGYRNQEILVELRLVPAQLKEIEAMARELTRRLRRASGQIAAA